MASSRSKETVQKLKVRWSEASEKIRDTVPPGGRAPLGLLLIIGGIFGILPILGFWMIPLGVAVVAMDVGPLVRAITRRGDGGKTNSEHDPDSAETQSRSDGGTSNPDDKD